MKFNKSIFGMIHLYGINPLERALEEIQIYQSEGLQGAIVENYHGNTDDVIEVLRNLKDNKIEIGINILPNEYEVAFELADQYGASFIQMDYISGRYEKNTFLDVDHYKFYRNKYPNISVLGGVWPKYYQPVKGSDLKEDLTKAKMLCDAIVVTGSGTGKETPLDKIKTFREIVGDFPIIIGAGLTSDNIEQLKFANGAIVGSYFKNGDTTLKVDKDLVKKFMADLNK